jgi:transcriptional regulator with XRE-family HTH domain
LSIATTKQDLLNSLKDREYRAAFNLENVYTTICFQLRALREQREMSQACFGQQVKPKMYQERISILEDPNAESKPTLNTLLRLAEGLDVGLEVRFVPFSTVLERSTHTDMRELEVVSFDDELPRLDQAIAFEAARENRTSAAFLWQAFKPTVPAQATGVPGINQAQSPWSVKVNGTVQQKKQPSSEHNIFLVQGELANAASVGTTG